MIDIFLLRILRGCPKSLQNTLLSDLRVMFYIDHEQCTNRFSYSKNCS